MFLGPALPFPLQTADNPKAPPREVWDSILEGLRANRTKFVRESVPGIFGLEADDRTSVALVERYERIIDEADPIAIERCIMLITGTDLTDSLKTLNNRDLSILCIHGDSNHSAPFEATTQRIKELVSKTNVRLYENAAHGT